MLKTVLLIATLTFAAVGLTACEKTIHEARHTAPAPGAVALAGAVQQ